MMLATGVCVYTNIYTLTSVTWPQRDICGGNQGLQKRDKRPLSGYLEVNPPCLLLQKILYTKSALCIYILTGGSDSKSSAYSLGDPGLIPGLGRSPGEGNGNPLQYSCLESPMDGGVGQVAVHGTARSWTGPCNFHFPFWRLKW